MLFQCHYSSRCVSAQRPFFLLPGEPILTSILRWGVPVAIMGQWIVSSKLSQVPSLMNPTAYLNSHIESHQRRR